MVRWVVFIDLINLISVTENISSIFENLGYSIILNFMKMYALDIFSCYKLNLCIISRENQNIFDLYFPF